ncbi:MAG: transposase [Anaerolineae bacterium]|nr:transposase [Anaerolineae bacterium]
MRERRKYTAELKRGAVELSCVSDKTVTQMARELRISPKLLYQWRRMGRRLLVCLLASLLHRGKASRAACHSTESCCSSSDLSASDSGRRPPSNAGSVWRIPGRTGIVQHGVKTQRL